MLRALCVASDLRKQFCAARSGPACHPAAGCFKVNSEVELANHDTDIQKLLYDDDLILETALYEAIKGGQVNQEIDKAKDALATARFFMNTVAGMRVYAKFRKDRKLFEDIAKTALSVIA